MSSVTKKLKPEHSPIVSLIVAVDRKGGIGFEGKLPWYSPRDLAYFKETTMGCPVIMGSKTMESLPDMKPLPGRINIVVSSSYEAGEVTGFRIIRHPLMALMEGLEAARVSGSEEVFVIGGAKTYEVLSGAVKRIYRTVVGGEYDVDTYFPSCLALEGDWERIRVKHMRATKKEPSLTFEVWENFK